MQMSLTITLLILIALLMRLNNFRFSSANGQDMSHETDVQYPCQLNFDVLQQIVEKIENRPGFLDGGKICFYVHQGVRLVRANYLQTHGDFLPTPFSSGVCWDSYRAFFNDRFDIQSYCGFHPEWFSRNCSIIVSKEDFENLVNKSSLEEARASCNESLKNENRCSLCRKSLEIMIHDLLGNQKENANSPSDCAGYAFMYAATSINRFGPTNMDTAKCLLLLQRSSKLVTAIKRQKHVHAILGAVSGCVVGVLGAATAIWLIRRRRNDKLSYVVDDSSSTSKSELIARSTTVVKFKYEEMKRATNNFSRENIIGTGKYGNVYKGKLKDGSEVALKRMKCRSVNMDGSFVHEVNVIASVNHVNLVSLRGYSMFTDTFEGCQRILVCDFIPNGSLFDHLHGSRKLTRLSWPIRQKIAIGTAHGLAYLHHGVQPAIIHRDVKSSNILLGMDFEAKIADFGLAKYNPNEMTHMSTRLAGTLGFVSPEYALYGKLTERSDVYSFGVVLLEILSGKKAIISTNEKEISLLTDWAWSLVAQEKAIDVIEDHMPEVGLPEEMEKYVYLAAVCCHQNLLARPTMEQVVKMLETKQSFPTSHQQHVSGS